MIGDLYYPSELAQIIKETLIQWCIYRLINPSIHIYKYAEPKEEDKTTDDQQEEHPLIV